MRPRLDAGEYGTIFERSHVPLNASMRPRLDAGEYRSSFEKSAWVTFSFNEAPAGCRGIPGSNGIVIMGLWVLQ